VIVIIGLLLLFLVQVGTIIELLTLPPDIVNELYFSRNAQMMIAVTWASVSLWVIMGIVRGKTYYSKHGLWIIYGLIVYSLLRLVLFAQADYDRQRVPFLVVLLGIFFVLGIVARYIRVVVLRRSTNEK
jgi:hypothetical protein